MYAGGPETHRASDLDIFGARERWTRLASFLRLALVGAGAGLTLLATVSAFVLFGMRRNIFGIWPTGSSSVIDFAIVGRAFLSLFLLLIGCHFYLHFVPVVKATDMPFAEAMM